MFRFAVTLCFIFTCSSLAIAKTLHVVDFDAPAIVVAEPVNPAVVASPLTGGELMRLRIPVSSFIHSNFRGHVNEYLVEVKSPSMTMRVVDFWPKTETFSTIDGTIAVQQTKQRDDSFTFQVSGSYPGVANGSANGNFHNKVSSQETYVRKPAMQILTSSGTAARGFGAFFKFRPGPNPVLEGARDIALLVEVPLGWRADALEITMEASGVEQGNNSQKQLGTSRLWTAIHREGDGAAAAVANQFVTRERALRAAAAANARRVEQRSLPTVFHKLGASLDVIEPSIPEDYLVQAIFGDAPNRFNDATSKLPVDLRVAMLDYWEIKNNLQSLAQPTAPTMSQHFVAKPLVPAVQ